MSHIIRDKLPPVVPAPAPALPNGSPGEGYTVSRRRTADNLRDRAEDHELRRWGRRAGIRTKSVHRWTDEQLVEAAGVFGSEVVWRRRTSAELGSAPSAQEPGEPAQEPQEPEPQEPEPEQEPEPQEPEIFARVAGDVAFVPASALGLGADPDTRTRLEALEAAAAATTTTVVVTYTPREGEPVKPARTFPLAHARLADALVYATAGHSIRLIGPSGCGKTVLMRQVAEALHKKLVTVSCAATMTVDDLMGWARPHGPTGEFTWIDGPALRARETPNCLLFLDEMDNLDPNALVGLNALLAPDPVIEIAGRWTKPRSTLASGFLSGSALNTFGRGSDRLYVGRFAQDEAALDRGRCATLELDYDKDLERKLFHGDWPDLLAAVWRIRDRASEMRLRRVISTRYMADVTRPAPDGGPSVIAQLGLERTLVPLLAGWSDDELQKVGYGRDGRSVAS
jgi:energy-coupling factor transporter ATP-binding protein EcfA2